MATSGTSESSESAESRERRERESPGTGERDPGTPSVPRR